MCEFGLKGKKNIWGEKKAKKMFLGRYGNQTFVFV